MKSYIWVTFGFLAVAYYQMSDGADFQPGATGVRGFARLDPVIMQEMAGDAAVSRMALADTASLAPTAAELADPAQLALETAVLTAIRSQEPAEAVVPQGMALTDGDAQRIAVSLPAAEVEAPEKDLRSVNGTRVNLRAGPGTDHGVLGQLTRGTAVEVLEDGGTGWVRLQVMPAGQIGWIADFLLDES